jgi:hypothetical protein
MFLPWPKLANIFSLQEKMTSNYFVGIFVSIIFISPPKYVSFLSQKIMINYFKCKTLLVLMVHFFH